MAYFRFYSHLHCQFLDALLEKCHNGKQVIIHIRESIVERPKRKSIRVRDVVHLSYELVMEEDMEHSRQAIDFLRSKDLERYPFRPRPLKRIASENMESGYQELAEAIMNLDEKMDFIIAALDCLSEKSQPEKHDDVVRCDLSATGILFVSAEKFELGAYLQMSLNLGSYLTKPIHLIAQVRRIDDPDPAYGPHPYRIAVDFEVIVDDDREAIITHVFDIQRAQLRADRGKKDQSKMDGK